MKKRKESLKLRNSFLSIFCVTIMIATGFVSIANTIKADEGGGGGGGGGSSNGLIFDLNIYETNENPYEWKGEAPSYNAYFKEKSDSGHLVKFESNGYNFTYKIGDLKKQTKTGITTVCENQDVTGSVDGVEILYDGIYTDTTLKYTMEFSQLKETYILEKLPDNVDKEDLIFPSKLFYDNNDLEIYINGEKQSGTLTTHSAIEFRNATNKTIYRIPQPFLKDSPDLVWDDFENEFVPDLSTIETKLCYYTLTIDGNHIDLNLVVSYSFVKEGNTYPLYIDPSIEDPINNKVIYKGLANNTIKKTVGNKFTFHLEAYGTENSENDEFVFEYSKDDDTYIEMVTVTKTVDDDEYQTFEIPFSVSGTIYIRVKDTDQTAGNKNLDSIFIDNMFIRSESADDLTTADIPEDGTVTGTHAKTQSSDDDYESIEEVESGGNPANRYSFLEHKWTISLTGECEVAYYENEDNTIVQESDLLIQNGGQLTIDNILLKMQSTSSTTLKIDVQSGGAFNIIENSKITADNTNYEYNFYYRIMSSGTIADSIIEYVASDSKGIQLASDVVIEDTTIQNNELHGIYCYQSNPTITGSEIKNNNDYGIYCDHSFGIIENNDIINNDNGIRVISSSPKIKDNTIESNIASTKGIYITDSVEAIISGNEISSYISTTQYEETCGILCEDNPYGIRPAVSDIFPDPPIFGDDMESGTNGWTHGIVLGSGEDLWNQDTSNYYSYETSWYMGQSEDYSDSIDSALKSPSIDLTEVNNASLSFWHDYEMEYSWDGGQVEVSTDSGTNWAVVVPEMGYDDTIQYDSGFAHSMTNEMAFTGSSGGWIYEMIDLTPYVGNNVLIRFHFVSDTDSTTDKGWYIDDVLVQTIPYKESYVYTNISFNDITENNYGIYAHESSVEIFRNNIESNDYGIYCDYFDYEEAKLTIFSDDMETDPHGWTTPGGSQPNWHKVTSTSHSPIKSWWCGSDSTSEYGPNMDKSLESPTFSLVDYTTATLTFWHKYQFETNDDYGYVDISTNGGTNWDPLMSYSNYYGPTVFEKEVIDISSYVGNSNVIIRFRFTSDSDTNVYSGWFIDDVVVKSYTDPANLYDQGTVDGCDIITNDCGIYFDHSSPLVEYCLIQESTGDDLYIETYSQPTIVSTGYNRDKVIIEDTSQNTDGDLYSDNDEIYIFRTDPFNIDSDNDDILDNDEINTNVYIFEAEDYRWNPDQIKTLYDNDLTEITALTPDPTRSDQNMLLMILRLPDGIYQCYYRGLSTNYNKISVGVQDDSDAYLYDDEFILRKEFRWYITQEIVIDSSATSFIQLWMNSLYQDVIVDKIMMVKIKNLGGSYVTGVNPGQITDPNDPDTDGDLLIDSFELDSNIWWFEAEHHRYPNPYVFGNAEAVEVNHLDASNGKAITLQGSTLGVANVLDAASFPPLLQGDEYKLYVRAKGSPFIDSFVILDNTPWPNTNEYVTHSNIFLTKNYRWYSTPVFKTTNMPTKLYFEINVPPPHESAIYIDKILLMRIKDNTPPPTGPQDTTINPPGQISDPLDPDTDIDGRIDGKEVFQDVYWFEAEDCIHYPIYDHSNPNQYGFDLDNQIAQDYQSERYSSNNRVVQGRTSDYKLIDPNYIPSHPKVNYNGDFRLYVKARKCSSAYNTLSSYTNGIQHSYILTPEYRWYSTTFFNANSGSPSIDIIDGPIPPHKARVDKIMLAKKDIVEDYSGQITDPLDPDVDFDNLTDGMEANDNKLFFEAEHYPLDNAVLWGYGIASNSKEIHPDTSSPYGILDLTISIVFGGIYKLYIKGRGTNEYIEDEMSVNIENDVTGWLIQNENHLFIKNFKWQSTNEFNCQAGSSIRITIYATSGNTPIIDKILLVRTNGDNKYLTDPLDPDTDGEGLQDGRELTNDVWLFEAEDYDSAGTSIIIDRNSISGLKVRRTSDGEFFTITDYFPQGKYQLFVRAKTDTEKATLTINAQTDYLTTYYFDLSVDNDLIDRYRWYYTIFGIRSWSAGEKQLTISGECTLDSASYVDIDKIILARFEDENWKPTSVKVCEVTGLTQYLGLYRVVPGDISDPLEQDSDGDTLTDKEEVLSEFGERTDPLGADRDLDNLEDNLELGQIPISDYTSNPNNADTDYDGIPDGWIDGWGYDIENRKWQIGEQNRLKEEPGETDKSLMFMYVEGEDIDCDGLFDYSSGHLSETKPNDGDTDHDASGDRAEYVIGTYPFDKDTDDDGLLDGQEGYTNGGTYRSDPKNPDTDDDSLPDGLEKGLYYDILNPSGDTITDDNEAGSGILGTDTSIFGTGDADKGVTKTKPTNPDSDYDGLPDGWIDGWSYHLDTDWYLDQSAKDGIKDPCEYEDYNLDGFINGDDNNDGIIDPTESWQETDPNNFDTDCGGLSDGWEILFTDPYDIDVELIGTDYWDFDPLDSTDDLSYIDSDSDGLIDILEDPDNDGIDGDWGEDGIPNTNDNGEDDCIWQSYETWKETNPNDADTDDDGLVDGNNFEEFEDSDEDGFINALDFDSDNDGLHDGQERGKTSTDTLPGTDKTSLKFKSDSDSSTTTFPTEFDSDGDMLPDGWIDGWGYFIIIKDWNIHDDKKDNSCTIGVKYLEFINAEGEDKDLDGEVDAGSWNNGNGVGETDPNNNDSDGDDIPDGIEIIAGINPLDWDTDNDRLPDGWIDYNSNNKKDYGEYEELTLNGRYDGIYKPDEGETNPNDPDSDGDDFHQYILHHIFGSDTIWWDDEDGDGNSNPTEEFLEPPGSPLVNDDNDYYYDHPNSFLGFNPYSEDEIWLDNDNSLSITAGDSCLYPGLDGIQSTTGPLVELINEERDLNDWNELMYIGTKPNDRDTDTDTLPDWWEFQFVQVVADPQYLDPTDYDSDGDTIWDNIETEDGSQFNDFLPNEYEYKLGTSPWKDDTDCDGYKDGDEYIVEYTGSGVVINKQSDPLDQYSIPNNDNDEDGDSDAIDDDDDNDGLTDDYELKTDFDPLIIGIQHTDPMEWDSDGDNLGDGYEVNDYLNYEGYNGFNFDSADLNPTNPDTDNDGLNDDFEDGCISSYYYDASILSPTNPDSDNDLLKDGEEDIDGNGYINLGFNNDPDEWESDPTISTTDGDSWNDFDEVKRYGTNPGSIDTDNDGENDDSDIDPLLQKIIIVKILRCRREDYVDHYDKADFHLKVKIEDEWFTTGVLTYNDDDIFPEREFWHTLSDESATNNEIDIQIELYDYDSSDPDYGSTRCDISSRTTLGSAGRWISDPENGRALKLKYNLKTGEWQDDDNLLDWDGYGHSMGEDDGESYPYDYRFDCEIWFNIYQYDYDFDGITWWKETHDYYPNLYGIHPRVHNLDEDGDGIDAWWEEKFGYSPISIDNHDLDPDNDGLTNRDEYRVPFNWVNDNINKYQPIPERDYWTSDPRTPDIYIEVDYMDDGSGCNHRLKGREKFKIWRNFNMGGGSIDYIALHIDDGWMGGGSKVPHQDEIDDAYWGVNNGHFDTAARGGIFHYCLMAHQPTDQPEWWKFWEGNTLGRGSCPGLKFCLFDMNLNENDQAHTFIHELAHNIIGKQYTDGLSGKSYNPFANHLEDAGDDDHTDKEHCPESYCALKTENLFKPIIYCSNCWNSIDLLISFDKHLYNPTLEILYHNIPTDCHKSDDIDFSIKMNSNVKVYLNYKYESDTNWNSIEFTRTSFYYQKGGDMEADYQGTIPGSFIDDHTEDIIYYFYVRNHDPPGDDGPSRENWFATSGVNINVKYDAEEPASLNPYYIEIYP